MTTRETISKSVAASVREIVGREMKPFGLVSVDVTAAEDHDGDPILWIDANYGPGGDPIEREVVAGLVTKLRDRLWDLGETRFPHVRHHFLEEQRVAGDS